MERKLILLGMVRNHEMHGYQINEMLDAHLGSSVHITRPTAYRLLNQMTEDGWIHSREEQEGNRPTRRVYKITELGEAEFQNTLRKCLARFEPPEYRSSFCLAYLDQIPESEAVQLLGKRREVLDEFLEALIGSEKHHGSFQLVIDHQIYHLNAELEWLDKVLDGVSTQKK